MATADQKARCAEREVEQPKRAGSIMAVISRVAGDPTINIETLERLMGLYERDIERKAKAAFSAALADMQPELPVVRERGGIKDRNGNVQSTYALWEDINAEIKPVLAKHGFSLSFRINREPDRVTVTGVLLHRAGHSEGTTISLPVDTSGSKNAVQAVGSSVSYGQRYTARALLNLTSRGEDDDGNGAGEVEKISESQQVYLQDLVEETQTNVQRLLAVLKVGHIAELPAARFDEVVQSIKDVAKRREARRA